MKVLNCCPEVHVMENKVSREWLTTIQLDRAARFGSKLDCSYINVRWGPVSMPFMIIN